MSDKIVDKISFEFHLWFNAIIPVAIDLHCPTLVMTSQNYTFIHFENNNKFPIGNILNYHFINGDI